MSENEFALLLQQSLGVDCEGLLPQVITGHGERTARRFLDFFLVKIRNRNTRLAYATSLKQFLGWCDEKGLALERITPFMVGFYIEQHPGSPATVNQHLAAIRSLFAWLMAGGTLERNPALEVSGIKHEVTTGKTPVLSDEEMRTLLDSINTSSLIGLRDRALIATMFYSFARIGAVVAMQVKDYFPKGKRYWLRLKEKGGKDHQVPCHHRVEEYLDAYLEAAGIADQALSPLFRSFTGRNQGMTLLPLKRQKAWEMVKRRSLQAGITTATCNHSFRASGITNFLKHGGIRENAQKIAAHKDVRTTALYDRRSDEVSLDEIERIRL
ncbi:MAG: tyrosine-type recombinase/integrase [Candidatus Nanopelagicaceae bacterium]